MTAMRQSIPSQYRIYMKNQVIINTPRLITNNISQSIILSWAEVYVLVKQDANSAGDLALIKLFNETEKPKYKEIVLAANA